MRKRESAAGWLFITPALLHLLAFAVFPIGYALWLSFFDWQILEKTAPFVGFENYVTAFSDESFWNSIWRTIYYAAGSVPLGMAVALAVAILVSQRLRGMAIFRTIYYIPAISSTVALSMIWIYIYLPESGMINALLGSLGLPSGTDFLNSTTWAMPALIFMSIWIGLGPKMVIYLAGLLAIPAPLYEAAELDGATGWRAFRFVTLPMLAPTTLFILVTSTIGAFQVFTPVYMMTKGGPAQTTDVIGYHIYVEAWSKFLIGLASSKSFILLVIIGALAYVQYLLMKSQLEGYSSA